MSEPPWPAGPWPDPHVPARPFLHTSDYIMARRENLELACALAHAPMRYRPAEYTGGVRIALPVATAQPRNHIPLVVRRLTRWAADRAGKGSIVLAVVVLGMLYAVVAPWLFLATAWHGGPARRMP